MTVLTAVVLFLDAWLFLSGLLPYYDLSLLFDAAREDGIGSWVAVTQSAFVALTAGLLAVLARKGNAPAWVWWGWAFTASLFAYVSVDDGTRLHERIGGVAGEWQLAGGSLGLEYPSYLWQLLVGPFFAVAGIVLVTFLWRECPGTRARVTTLGGAALLGVAIGLDVLEGLDASHPLNAIAALSAHPAATAIASPALQSDPYETVTHLVQILEEGLEIVGVALLWDVVLDRWRAIAPDVRGTFPSAA